MYLCLWKKKTKIKYIIQSRWLFLGKVDKSREDKTNGKQEN